MPLFFVLSGYTIKDVTCDSQIIKRIAKYAKQLLIPVAVIEFVRLILSSRSLEDIRLYAITLPHRLFWASGGSNTAGTIEPLGYCWFLIALFYAKVIYDILLYVFREYSFLPSVALALIGAAIGHKMFLPQEADVCLLVVGFLAVGHELRKLKLEEKSDFFINLLGVISAALWLVILAFGIRIEIAIRDYQHGIVSIIEAIGASLFFVALSIELDRSGRMRWVEGIGRNTIWIFAVHSLDRLVPLVGIWSRGGLVMHIMLRIILDCGIALLLAGSYKYVLNKFKNRRNPG